MGTAGGSSGSSALDYAWTLVHVQSTSIPLLTQDHWVPVIFRLQAASWNIHLLPSHSPSWLAGSMHLVSLRKGDFGMQSVGAGQWSTPELSVHEVHWVLLMSSLLCCLKLILQWNPYGKPLTADHMGQEGHVCRKPWNSEFYLSFCLQLFF